MKTRIHLARTGRFRDGHDRTINVDGDMLRELAESYDADAFKAPLVLGHPSDGAPAHGWVERLVIDGDELYGEVDQVSTDLADAVKAGRYRNVSISWWPRGHPSSPNAETAQLRHVGILGAQTPVVKGLKPLEFSDDDSIVAIEFADASFAWYTVKEMARAFREFLIGSAGQEEADRLLPSYTIDTLARAAQEAEQGMPSFGDPTPPPPTITEPEDPAMSGTQTKPAAGDAEKAAELADREAKLVEREAAIELAEKEAAEKAAEARKTAAIDFADALIKGGKLAPAGKDVVIDIHQRLAADGAVIEFADGAKKPALAEFAALFEGAKPIVNLAEVSKDDQVATIDGNSDGDLTARAKAIKEANPAISFSEAVRKAEAEAAA
ncbi:MAG: hypothetical protein AAF415_12915 [Pseudomonadota bacterium]